MGFPNVDLWLVNQFVEQFEGAQGDPGDPETPDVLSVLIADTFPDLDAAKRAEIQERLAGYAILTDLRTGADGPTLTIMPGFPLTDVPFPQISVVVAGEMGNDIPLGFGTGEATAVYDPEDESESPAIIGWDMPKAYWATCTYQVQVLCGHWWELIWLTRLCQRFILGMERTLAAQDVFIEAITVADLQLNPQQFPTLAFARGISLTCRASMSVTDRLPASTYETGVNVALVDLEA